MSASPITASASPDHRKPGRAGGAPADPTRCLVFWFPAWPVRAWALEEGRSPTEPVAVVAANRVLHCSEAALAEGVSVGQRRREAQATCPTLRVIPADEARDSREFEPVVACIEELAPGVQVVAPGQCAVRARGLASYIGSEAEAAETLLEAVVVALGITGGRIGIADGLFAATQAARVGSPVGIVPVGGSARFLAPLPISRLGDEGLTTLLPRLGVRTLGEFAALAAAAVRDRFGLHGVRLHTLASGFDPSTVQPRTPPPELTRQLDFEPALTLVEQVAFSARSTAEAFIGGLTDAGLACTEIRVELLGDRDELVARNWLAAAVFDASAVVDRVRWQLQAAAGNQLRSGVVSLRLEPIAVDALAHHIPGLFGSGPDERVHHVLSRVQGMLGHAGVVTPQLAGGRWLAERQVLVPWGDRPRQPTPRERPWPGQVPAPLPATVFAELRSVQLVGAGGHAVALNGRGFVTDPPIALRIDAQHRTVIGWAGPWPIDERPWDPERHRVACRFQVVDGSGTAWLLLLDERGWWAEARYD